MLFSWKEGMLVRWLRQAVLEAVRKRTPPHMTRPSKFRGADPRLLTATSCSVCVELSSDSDGAGRREPAFPDLPVPACVWPLPTSAGPCDRPPPVPLPVSASLRQGARQEASGASGRPGGRCLRGGEARPLRRAGPGSLLLLAGLGRRLPHGEPLAELLGLPRAGLGGAGASVDSGHTPDVDQHAQEGRRLGLAPERLLLGGVPRSLSQDGRCRHCLQGPLYHRRRGCPLPEPGLRGTPWTELCGSRGFRYTAGGQAATL